MANQKEPEYITQSEYSYHMLMVLLPALTRFCNGIAPPMSRAAKSLNALHDATVDLDRRLANSEA